MWVVPLSKLDPLLRFKFYRERLKKHRFLKDTAGTVRLTPKYYHLMRDILTPSHFYSEVLFFACGTIPGWILLGKKIVDSKFVGFLCCFGIPWLIVERCVLRKDTWLKYWNQIESMPSQKRRKLLVCTCIVDICLWILYVVDWIVCVPIANRL